MKKASLGVRSPWIRWSWCLFILPFNFETPHHIKQSRPCSQCTEVELISFLSGQYRTVAIYGKVTGQKTGKSHICAVDDFQVFSFNNRHFFDFMGSKFHKLQVGKMLGGFFWKGLNSWFFWLEYFSNRDDRLNYFKSGNTSITIVGWNPFWSRIASIILKNRSFHKVQLFCEGHENLKKSPTCFDATE